jgi:hypothetical protein
MSFRNPAAIMNSEGPATDGGLAVRIAGSYRPMSSTTWPAVAQTQPVSTRGPRAPEQGVSPSRGQTAAT